MSSPIVMGSERYSLPGKVEIGLELKPPISDVSTGPELGAGSQRYNPTTGLPEYWDGTQWLPYGSGVDSSNWTPGNSFAS